MMNRKIDNRSLTRDGNVIAYRGMNTKVLVGVLALAALLAAGCVKNVSGGRTAGVPWVKDRIEGRYQRPVDVVFNAAKDVVLENGILNNESVLHNETNQVKTLVGKVNQRSVFIRVSPVEPKVTSVIVQARIPGGGADVDLAHQLEKQIALKLIQ